MDLDKSQIPNPKFQRVEDTKAYGKAVEDHLCKRNGGHLIRISGPSWDLVQAWESKGIPLKVVYQGIDRTVERHHAKGPQRRPIQLSFCTADVLDAFDEWRKAVGVTTAGLEDAAPARRESLPAHLERAIARLTSLRGGGERALDPILDDVIRELDAAKAGAKGLRGQARTDLLSRLAEIDASLLAAGRAMLDPAVITGLTLEADDELRAFRGRMAPDAYERSRAACVDRLVRERLRLPVLALD